MGEIVSVIVPVYNSEEFLVRCIDSILSQTYRDFELILIDDGSVDQSGSICDIYANKDNRVKVIHQSNAGAAAARNLGIRRAVGKYLMFCDSDDMVGPMWIMHLVSCVEEDVLPISAYCRNKGQLGQHKKLDGVIEKERVNRSEYYYYHKAGIAGYVCNALYRRDIVIKNSISFRVQRDEGDYNEDLLFALTYVKKIKSLIYTGYADYLYDVHEGSLSRSYERCYFNKYMEKYNMWKEFVRSESDLDRKQCLKELATVFCYHVLISLQKEVDLAERFISKEHYSRFYTILHSNAVQECISLADTSRENKGIILGVKYKCNRLLWIFFKFVKLKKRWRPAMKSQV